MMKNIEKRVDPHDWCVSRTGVREIISTPWMACKLRGSML